jgi:4-hydroxy-tetrahydrodipicolinate synthase
VVRRGIHVFWEKARALNDKLHPLIRALFADSSPGPCKYAMGRVLPEFSEDVRLPLVRCGAETRQAVDAALEHAGLRYRPVRIE